MRLALAVLCLACPSRPPKVVQQCSVPEPAKPVRERSEWKTIGKANDVLGVSGENLEAAPLAILAEHGEGKPVVEPWNGRSAPRYLDLVDGRMHLDAADGALLKKNGFVVVSAEEAQGY